MRIDFNHLTRTSVTALCQQAHVAVPTHSNQLHLFTRTLHARAQLDKKIAPAPRTTAPRTAAKAVDIKKLQAGDHDD